jgi:hypothetical protein
MFAYPSCTGITLNIKNTLGATSFPLERDFGVLIPPYNWTEVVYENKDAKLNVLANKLYDPNDYIYPSP